MYNVLIFISEIYAVLPPFELFMNMDKTNRQRHFFEVIFYNPITFKQYCKYETFKELELLYFKNALNNLFHSHFLFFRY